jgi:hypothetical protein
MQKSGFGQVEKIDGMTGVIVSQKKFSRISFQDVGHRVKGELFVRNGNVDFGSGNFKNGILLFGASRKANGTQQKNKLSEHGLLQEA